MLTSSLPFFSLFIFRRRQLDIFSLCSPIFSFDNRYFGLQLSRGSHTSLRYTVKERRATFSSNMQQSSAMSPPIGSSLSGNNSTSGAPGVGSLGASSPLTARRPYLYVGNLSSQVNEVILREIFGSVGPVISTKIVADRNANQAGSLSYGFVEFADLRSAETALQSLNGRKIFDVEIKVDWAASSLPGGEHSGIGSVGMAGKESTSSHFHVFVGDLAPEINDQMLRQAFQNFTSISEARVMWDANSGKSRGYGFVAFREKNDAEQAIATMNGEWLGSRAIRVNWANQKGNNATVGGSGAVGGIGGHGVLPGHNVLQGQNRSAAIAAALGGMGAIGLGATSMPPTGGASSGTPITYEQALAGSAPHNTTVYVGNIPPYATQNDLIPLFSQYGYIIEIRMQADRGFAFIKLDTHENAASAIVNLAGQIACGRPIKCGWGKDRNESAMLGALRQGMQLSGYGNVVRPIRKGPCIA